MPTSNASTRRFEMPSSGCTTRTSTTLMGKGPRPDSQYQEVIVLRQRSRGMLDGLARLFLAKD
jgi:hypothetical protein